MRYLHANELPSSVGVVFVYMCVSAVSSKCEIALLLSPNSIYTLLRVILNHKAYVINENTSIVGTYVFVCIRQGLQKF